jgi:DeoR family transcriptional regulator, fructose operon transcriptional repressor
VAGNKEVGVATPTLADERRNRLLEIVRGRGFASLLDLAAQLEVSESTVRRDLEALEDTGAIQRTHGGVFYTGPSPKLSHFDVRQQSNWSRKRKIAVAASRLIEDGDTILLDGGSTTYELAQLLVGRPLQVVTNSLPVATLFTSSDSGDLVLVGGIVHTHTGVTLGPYANEMLGKLNVQKAVISVAGVNEKGFYNSNPLLVETEKAMMQAADEVIVVADSTKFGHASLSHMCELAAIQTLVVDQELSPQWRERIEQAGVRLIIANEEPMKEMTNDQ